MKRSTKIRILRHGASQLFCLAALPLSAQTLTHAAGVIRSHRTKIGSCWRKLSPGRQAPPVLPACGQETPSPSWPPGLARAPPPPGSASHKPWPYRRPARRNSAGNRRRAQARLVSSRCRRSPRLVPIDRRRPAVLPRPAPPLRHEPAGHPHPRWRDLASLSGSLPGAVHDLTVTRIWGIVQELAAAGLVVLAGTGYHGAAEHVLTSCQEAEQARLAEGCQPRACPATIPRRARQRTAETWRILRKLRCYPWKAGQLARAIHVRQAREIAG